MVDRKKNPLARVSLLAAAVLLAGCSMAPTYERPAAPVPQYFPNNPAQIAGQPATAEIAWQDYFTDPRLVGLIDTALANNRDLRVAVANIEAALAAAHLRFRPIIMTSLAFGLGVVPLFISTGAGSASRRAIGTGVLGGMVTGTALAVIFVPVFFVVVRSLFKGSERQHEVDKRHAQAAGIEESPAHD